jgi:DNA-binding helix-hairpin-helix protein with protein kinase domain
MNRSPIYVDNKRISLGARIGKGAEGEVFAISDDATIAAKIYTVPDVAARESKIKAMIQGQLAQRAPLIAFPLSVVRNEDGSFAGFIMRLMEGHRPLHDLQSPGSRKHKFPRADFRFLVRAACNIARTIAWVHHSSCVIGDINHSSILISQKATVALIEADSFQIGSDSGRFYCVVGVPEYTPPELQGRSLADIVRTPNHDAFGLAIVIFQLLFMGRHPFVGTVRRGDIPPLHDAIREFRFVYAEGSGDVGMDQPPGRQYFQSLLCRFRKCFRERFPKREETTGPPRLNGWAP